MAFNYIRVKQIYLIFISCLLLSACGRSKKVDVSNIDVNVKIERFDHDLDEMRSKPMDMQAVDMFKKYGPFYADYIQRVMQYGSIGDTGYFKQLHEMFAGSGYRDLKHDVDSIYPGEMDKQNEELTDAFRRRSACPDQAATSSRRDDPRIKTLRPSVVRSGKSSHITTSSSATRVSS